MMKKILLFLLIFLVSFVSAEICGNGSIDFLEQCDDGNNQSGDGCSSLCEFEDPIVIPEIPLEQPFCYNDLQICVEVISSTSLNYVKLSCTADSTQVNKTMILDDESTYCAEISNSTLGAVDGLNVECLIIAENQVAFSIEEMIIEYDCPECGDQIIERDEVCDNGTLNGVLCDAGYNEFCSYCTSSCTVDTLQGSYCGDQICNQYFENWTNCNLDCEKPKICGDGFLDDGEECDGSKDCLDNCKIKEEKQKRYSSITNFYEDCEPIWECSSWSDCKWDVRYRECVDKNNCQYGYNRPLETVGCEVVKESSLDDKSDSWLFVILATLILILTLLIILLKK